MNKTRKTKRIEQSSKASDYSLCCHITARKNKWKPAKFINHDQKIIVFSLTGSLKSKLNLCQG